MPRVYKPKPGAKIRKKYNEIIIKEALDELSRSDASINSVAQKYGISKSVLGRHKLQEMKSSGGQTALSVDTENYIVQNLNTAAEWGYPLTTMDLRFVVKMYLDTLGIKNKRFKNNLPGPDFVEGFLKRHKNMISKRICQNIKRSRAKVSPETIKEYHLELQKSIANVPLSNIINYDETNLTDDPGRKQVIVKRGCKYPERVMNHTKGSVSLMMAATADGETLPPYVVYKATNVYNTWTENGPKNARYASSKSGWFDGEIFADWIEQMVIPMLENRPGKKVLIGDNLSSHLSVDLIKLCKEKDIHFLFLPANSTHLTQPLDVAYFRPMKTAWRHILEKWKNTDGRTLSTIPKGCFPRLLKLFITQLHTNSENNIKAGFRKTGIAPLDVNVILARLPQTQNNEADKDAIDSSFINLLKEMRFGTMHIKEPKNKRKLDIVAGRSVSEEEAKREPAIKKNKLEIALQERPSTSQKSGKGKGTGKKTKEKLSSKVNMKVDTHQNFDLQEIEHDSVDITKMQVTFENNLDSREVDSNEAEKKNSEEAATKSSKEDESIEELRNLEVERGISVSGEEPETASAMKKKKLKTIMQVSSPSPKQTGTGIEEAKKNLLLKINTEVNNCRIFEQQEIEPDDITHMPFFFADDLEYNEVVVECDSKETIQHDVKHNIIDKPSKIEIISDIKLPVPLKLPKNKKSTKNKNFYNEAEEILKILEE